jgi:hypothetical protein
LNKKNFEMVELKVENFVPFAVVDLSTLLLVEIEFVLYLKLMFEEYLKEIFIVIRNSYFVSYVLVVGSLIIDNPGSSGCCCSIPPVLFAVFGVNDSS